MKNFEVTNSVITTVEQSLNKYFEETSTIIEPRILLAVSGGADSMVMLDVIAKLSNIYNFSLFVVTVNHNMRSDEESASVDNFVMESFKNHYNIQSEIVRCDTHYI